MKSDKEFRIDYLFEISWEVCNKVGGIYTSIASKVSSLKEEVKEHILIGPDLVREQTTDYFIEDTQLFKFWRQNAFNDGLRIRVGRWNIESKPIVILVDFTDLFSQKDKIFAELWEQYQLDSISGQWDYIEPTLFGYAAGKVIEHYTKFHTSPRKRIVTHFHEWMTGAGLLYLRKNTPQIACAFTAHATNLGRALAGRGFFPSNNIEQYNIDTKIREYDIVSKHSLEKNTAAAADCFTTASNIVANEAKYFLNKEVDLLTPNGIEKSLIADKKNFETKRKHGRNILRNVANAVTNTDIADDALFFGMSARYEYKAKGIDVYIDMLGKLNSNADLGRQIVAFLFVPTANHGASKEIIQRLATNDKNIIPTNNYTTHYLDDPDVDTIFKAIKNAGLKNTADDKVKIIFVPEYINGNDGIFNVKYYDLLVALDATIFPSRYEPWGYTPMESLALRVPTITTTLSGFGLYVLNNCKNHDSINVVEVNENNYSQVVDDIEKAMLRFSKFSENEIEKLRKNTEEVISDTIWEKEIKHYLETYKIALDKVSERIDKIIMQPIEETVSYIDKQSNVEKPVWTDIIVQSNVPTKLAALKEISHNLWWCWDQRAIELFKYIDADTFSKTNRNPILVLDTVSAKRFQELEEDAVFIEKLNNVYTRFKAYMSEKKSMKGPHIAYFCMEYGLQASLRIYSGGLGILAGDYLKEASDKSTRMTAVGLLYRYGYFTQKISAAGDQIAEYEAQDFTKIPVSPVRDKDGHWLTISIVFPGRNVYARVWKVEVGRTDLYLLDTDFEDNLPEDRVITHQLYGGDWENRLKQELILGVGGIRVLNALGIAADVYHCNEGHAAFTGLERIRNFIDNNNLTFIEALEVVRASSLFTTHTPVPAGHDAFEEDLLRKYISHYPEKFKVSWKFLMGLGKNNPNDASEKFSMSVLAANVSQEINGVSWLHGKVSRDIMKDIWTGYMPEELHIGYVTNGVHLPTWTAPQWKEVFENNFGEGFATHHYDKSCFEKIYNVDDKTIWDIRKALKENLVDHIRKRLRSNENIVHFTPHQIIKMSKTLDPQKLTIGFARRFATYKRAHLLFKNMERLEQIVNNPDCPVQFLFAGKAHPADKAGQDLIKMIVEYSKLPQFMGKIIFLDNYDMEVARRMVQGVDIWLNTPTRPLEASGTSGEKAVLNGVMHFSVLDGWWVEGYREDAGWCLPLERTYENQDFQDQLDSELVYNIIENEIAPLYYKRNKNDIPVEWIKHVKNSIAHVASNFTTNRMLIDYEERYYNKLDKRHASLDKNDFKAAREIAEWKKNVSREWDNISVISTNRLDISKETILLGKKYDVEVVLNIGALNAEDVGVEIVFAENKNGQISFIGTQEFKIESIEGSVVAYKAKIEMEKAGVYLSSYRVFPKNSTLPHRQDFGLVKWI